MKRTRVWRFVVPFTVLGLSVAASALPLKMPIMVYDRAGLSPRTWSQAEGLTDNILLTVGVGTNWIAGSTSDPEGLKMDFSARTSDNCANASGIDFVRVVVLAHAPAGVPIATLGFSLPCARTGIQVVIYADRIAKVSETNAPTFNRVLGYALAHELGHVLLRSAAHANTGLMRSIWSKSDWQRAAVSIIGFTPAQANQILDIARRSGYPMMSTTASAVTGPTPG